jgi:hypothetical protein
MKVSTGGIYTIIVAATLIVGTAAAATVATAKDDSSSNNNNDVRRHRRAGGLRRTAVLLKIDSESESESESSSSSTSSSSTRINKKQQEKVDSVADRILEETNIMQITASTASTSTTTRRTNKNRNANRNLLQAGWVGRANHQSIAQETNAYFDAADMANIIRNNEFSMSMKPVSFFRCSKCSRRWHTDDNERRRKEGVYSSYCSFYIRGSLCSAFS